MTAESVLSEVTMASTIVRVRNVSASVEWFRDKLRLEPLHVGADGEHKIAAYVLGGMVLSLWQLPEGEHRRREDAETNSYVVLVVNGDPRRLRAELEQRGVDVGDFRESANNSFFWFYDRDDNRFEVARPRTAAGEAAREAADNTLSA